MEYDSYIRPQPTLKYSFEYFASLTFERARVLDLPTVANPGSITDWGFDSREPFSAASTLVLPGEEVPHPSDLLPISNAMEDAFKKGARSVVIDFGPHKVVYHFSKIRLLYIISNNRLVVHNASSLYTHIVANDILLPSDLDRFRVLPIRAPITGFHVTRFPLSTLSCLLGETWLEEDVVNALLELLYLKNAILTNTDPSFLALPTFFSRDLRYLFQSGAHFYSSNISLIRRRLRALPTANTSFVTCEADHFSGYHYLPKFPSLRLGDSMGRPSSADILGAFNWFLLGLSDNGYPAPNTVGDGHLPRQGPQSGSCGIAAVNFVTRGEQSNPPIWEDTSSPAFRNKALQELILYHLTAMDEQTPFESWHAPCLLAPLEGSETLNDDPNLWVGYDDFNLSRPTSSHPIHLFVVRITQQPVIPLPRASPQNPSTKSNAMSNVPVSKLPALSASAPPIILPDDSNDDSGSVIDLTKSSPVVPAKLLPMKSEVIDLTGPTAYPPRPPLPPAGTIVLPNSDDEVVVTGEFFHGGAASKRPAKREPLGDLSNSQRPSLQVLSDIDIGTTYNSFDEGQAAVYALEASRGHIWKISQTKKVNDVPRRITLRCNHYYHQSPTHLDTIDPSDYRKGKTIKTDCMAHVNLCHNGDGTWRVSMTDWHHNHPPQLPTGGAIARPPTVQQQGIVANLCADSSGNFTRSQIAKILSDRFPNHILEPRQISNMMNKARREAREEVESLGGDMASIIAEVTRKGETQVGWRHSLRLNDQQVVVGFWWQSPIQAELTKRYGDVLLNDDTYNRNRYGYPLDIGIIIDNYGKSRNAWYSFHEKEDIDTHLWVLRQHLDAAGYPPEVFGSDRHPSLIGACSSAMPTTFHLYCLNHLDTNVTSRLRSVLSSQWPHFRNDFWTVYRAVSPEEFDRLWKKLASTYPDAQQYLDEEIYSCRQHWAWAWVGGTFTAGVRTTGRVESENRINKSIGGPKKTLLQLFRGLNERTNDQKVQDLIRHRQSARHQHATNVETLFHPVIVVLREHAGPFANQKCRREMDESMFYTAEVVQLPSGKRQWGVVLTFLFKIFGSLSFQDEYAFAVQEEPGYSWDENEETSMLNCHENDRAYISTRWLIHQVVQRGLQVKHLLRVTHRASGSVHYLALLRDGRYLCDCCMDQSLGLVCRHYFLAWVTVQDLPFHLSFIKSRWLQDPTLDVDVLPALTKTHQVRPENVRLITRPIQSLLAPRPPRDAQKKVSKTPHPPIEPHATETLGAREVFHEIQSAVRPLMSRVETREQVDDLIRSLDGIRQHNEERAYRSTIHDPEIIRHKGRPCTTRLTGAVEGQPSGGGGSQAKKRRLDDRENMEPDGATRKKARFGGRRCGLCRKEGHYRGTCPLLSL